MPAEYRILCSQAVEEDLIVDPQSDDEFYCISNYVLLSKQLIPYE